MKSSLHRLAAVVAGGFLSANASAVVMPGHAGVSVVNNGDNTYDYTFVFDQGGGTTTGDGSGLSFSGLGLELLVTPLTDSIYQCCTLSTDNVVQNNTLVHGGLGATSGSNSGDSLGPPGQGYLEALHFSIVGGGSYQLMDITLNGGGTDEAFGSFGINYDVTGARHFAYGSLLSNRATYQASHWDGVGSEHASRGGLGYGSNFVISGSISMAATNNICPIDPTGEACTYFDGYIESITLRTSTAPVAAVPAPASIGLLLLGLMGVAGFRCKVRQQL